MSFQTNRYISLHLIHKINHIRNEEMGKNKFMTYHKIELITPLIHQHYSISHKYPTRLVGEVTFNTQGQRGEFVNRHGTETDLPYVINHKNHNVIISLTNVNSAQHFFLPSP